MPAPSQNQAVSFLTPTGRLVSGSLYEPRDKDMDGNPLLIKNGPKKGQPRVDYYFALAIPKGGEQHWAYTTWGQVIYNAGVAAWPQGQTQRQDFAWKITDGDSQIPNKRGNKPCDNEGWPGHWIIHFSSSFAPKICDKTGANPITEVDAVKLGYYVQVYGNVASNESTQTAGMFLNHQAVSLQGYGTEIIPKSSVDTTKVGFGQGALPAGASMQPVGAALPMQPGGQLPGMLPPQAGMMPSMPPGGPLAVPPVVQAPVLPAPVMAVMPNPALTTLPGMQPVGLPQPVMPGTPPASIPQPVMAPPVAAVPQPVNNNARLTPKAQGATYEQLIANGWNDEMLKANGLMI